MAAVGQGLVVDSRCRGSSGGVGSTAGSRRRGRCGRLRPRVVGGGARTRRRGVRSRWRRRWRVRDLSATRWDSREQPALAAEIEGHRFGAEDGGQDAGGAGEPAGFAGGERLVGVEVGCLHRTGQDGVVDGDDHGGGGLGVQVVGGQVLEELGERESAAVPPVERPVLLLECLVAHPSGCGHRVDDLAEHRCGQGGDGEVSGGGAVTVVVQASASTSPGRLAPRCG